MFRFFILLTWLSWYSESAIVVDPRLEQLQSNFIIRRGLPIDDSPVPDLVDPPSAPEDEATVESVDSKYLTEGVFPLEFTSAAADDPPLVDLETDLIDSPEIETNEDEDMLEYLVDVKELEEALMLEQNRDEEQRILEHQRLVWLKQLSATIDDQLQEVADSESENAGVQDIPSHRCPPCNCKTDYGVPFARSADFQINRFPKPTPSNDWNRGHQGVSHLPPVDRYLRPFSTASRRSRRSLSQGAWWHANGNINKRLFSRDPVYANMKLGASLLGKFGKTLHAGHINVGTFNNKQSAAERAFGTDADFNFPMDMHAFSRRPYGSRFSNFEQLKANGFPIYAHSIIRLNPKSAPVAAFELDDQSLEIVGTEPIMLTKGLFRLDYFEKGSGIVIVREIAGGKRYRIFNFVLPDDPENSQASSFQLIAPWMDPNGRYHGTSLKYVPLSIAPGFYAHGSPLFNNGIGYDNIYHHHGLPPFGNPHPDQISGLPNIESPLNKEFELTL